MNRFLDKQGLELVWRQIVNKFATKQSVITKSSDEGQALSALVNGLDAEGLAKLMLTLGDLREVDLTKIQGALDILCNVGYNVPTIDSAPDKDTMNLETEDGTYAYNIGSFVRVKDQSSDTGYVFYQLYDIKENGDRVWAVAGSGGSGGSVDIVNETLIIKLVSNQSQPDSALIGSTIVVTDTDEQNALLSTTWQGEEIQLKVSPGTNYKIEVGEVEGYSHPESKSHTAKMGYSRTDEFFYNTTVVTVNMTTNQSSNDDIAGAKATVSYGSKNKQVSSGNSVKVPTGETAKVSFSDVEGFKKPGDISFETSGTSVTKSGQYQTEVVTVTCTAEDSASVAGQKVTINGTQHTLDASGKVTVKVPFDKAYTVVASDWNGYTTPSEQSFTASQASRSVSVLWETIKLGVFIEDKSGKLWKRTDWNSGNNTNANAIVVLTDACKVRLALTENSSTMTIHSSYSGALENYMTAISDTTQAKADYKGKENTENIMKLQSGTSYAAGYCNNFTFPDGKTKGHLPALGEWWTLYQNKAEVDACLSACGGTAMQSSYYWSSTFWGVNGGYRHCWLLYWSDGDVDYSGLTSYHRVRPVAAY